MKYGVPDHIAYEIHENILIMRILRRESGESIIRNFISISNFRALSSLDITIQAWIL